MKGVALQEFVLLFAEYCGFNAVGFYTAAFFII
jgi:hypothetical protein